MQDGSAEKQDIIPRFKKKKNNTSQEPHGNGAVEIQGKMDLQLL